MKATSSSSHTKSSAKSSAGRNPTTRTRHATKPQRGDSRRAFAPEKSRGEAPGYDADKGPLDTGLASKYSSLASEAEAEAVSEPGVSLPPEDLGTHSLFEALQSPSQSSGAENLSMPPTEEDSTSPASLDTLTAGDEEEDGNEDAISPREPNQIDLTQDVIYEGSLFDQPRDEGGTFHAAVRANEVDATLERNARAARARKGRRH